MWSRAILHDPLLAGSDTLATSTTLGAAIKKLGLFDLVLFGTRTSDSDTGQVGPQTAVQLDLPLITGVCKIEYKDSRLIVERRVDAFIEEYELSSEKIHNLVTLNSIIATVHEFNFEEDILGLLNKLYIDSRYPGDLGLLPDGRPTSEDARIFFHFAQEVYEAVKRFLAENPASSNK